MSKQARQKLILDIVKRHSIETQVELSEALYDKGVVATQATISRDIKELRISKVQSEKGSYKYALLENGKSSYIKKVQDICLNSVTEVFATEDLIIVKTFPGLAKICAQSIEKVDIPGLAGIIAGEDTIFIAVFEKTQLLDVKEKIKEMTVR